MPKNEEKLKEILLDRLELKSYEVDISIDSSTGIHFKNMTFSDLMMFNSEGYYDKKKTASKYATRKEKHISKLETYVEILKSSGLKAEYYTRSSVGTNDWFPMIIIQGTAEAILNKLDGKLETSKQANKTATLEKENRDLKLEVEDLKQQLKNRSGPTP